MPAKDVGRKGLVENAAGQLACPVCHEHRSTLVWIIYHALHATVSIHMDALRVVHQTHDEPKGDIDQHLTVLFRCRNNHEYATEMDYRPDEGEPGLGSAAYGTSWVEEGTDGRS